MNSYKFIISGKVQGVYYRKTIKENASKENFFGYVKNLSDGSVEACVTCDESRLDEFISILEKGSSYSKVVSINRYKIDTIFANGFNIL